jgi:Fic family protein
VIGLIRDQEATIEGLFDFVAARRTLSTSYIRELHQQLTRHQETIPLLRGEWKRLPNNPTRPDGIVHAYSPPVHVASEMDRLIAFFFDYQTEGVAPEVQAAWLHHRFTQIHPFQDGNGRIARFLVGLVFIQAKLFPLVLTGEDRISSMASTRTHGAVEITMSCVYEVVPSVMDNCPVYYAART